MSHNNNDDEHRTMVGAAEAAAAVGTDSAVSPHAREAAFARVRAHLTRVLGEVRCGERVCVASGPRVGPHLSAPPTQERETDARSN